MALLLALSLTVGLLGGGGTPSMPSLMNRADVVTPDQQAGTAKGRSHRATARQTTAGSDGRRVMPKPPKDVLPLDGKHTPKVVTDTAAQRPAPPALKRMPEPEPPKITGFDEQKSQEDPAQRTRYATATRTPTAPGRAASTPAR
ncbi:hypothetical protein DPM19_00440 [Actinomadura craniellae]|uniref:Uncharacterized protein n=1 Tax=Actinomadura craniellae TaxID=2231787 RepID=A0A365HC41_9ACTN|nr:hypothetical protein DPM19_00440 [Actinomadura craniellae]